MSEDRTEIGYHRTKALAEGSRFTVMRGDVPVGKVSVQAQERCTASTWTSSGTLACHRKAVEHELNNALPHQGWIHWDHKDTWALVSWEGDTWQT